MLRVLREPALKYIVVHTARDLFLLPAPSPREFVRIEITPPTTVMCNVQITSADKLRGNFKLRLAQTNQLFSFQLSTVESKRFVL